MADDPVAIALDDKKPTDKDKLMFKQSPPKKYVDAQDENSIPLQAANPHEDDDEDKANDNANIDVQLGDDDMTNIAQPDNTADQFYTAKAHRLRRVYHVTTFAIAPIIYFWCFPYIADGIGITVPKILSFLILLSMVLEYIRIKRRFIIFGMREYERDHICAQSWGTISTLIVFLLAFPRTYSIAPAIEVDANGRSTGSEAFACFGQIAIPIVWSLGIGDPLLGELKKYARAGQIAWWTMYVIADVVLTVIWVLCTLWCGTPWWLAIVIPPIAIIAEKPSLPHIDDNGLMLLIPLLFTLLLEPW
eukprot:CAMPEP_0197030610 /NCGR_PEP_ID=MMETSP1384-20130603/9815_1 /TAXON_ID=29189 /ORGANISM="Ammonia sp." /LENGTH=303 /DNA_ID=CAMNT_0042459995 /DNA_START=60 /DNA_END=968 /DNA_ORIENTATION=-